jgi:hypothetical protein
VVDKAALGQVLSEYFSSFPLAPISPIAPHLSSVIRSWNNSSNSDQRTNWTQSHPTQGEKKKKVCGICVSENCVFKYFSMAGIIFTMGN